MNNVGDKYLLGLLVLMKLLNLPDFNEVFLLEKCHMWQIITVNDECYLKLKKKKGLAKHDRK